MYMQVLDHSRPRAKLSRVSTCLGKKPGLPTTSAEDALNEVKGYIP